MVGQETRISPKKPTGAKSKLHESAADKAAREFLGARVAYAGYLTVYFEKIGRQMIHVNAIGDNQQTLEVVSALIGKPFGTETHNLISAREVVESSDSVALLKKCRFKTVVIHGTDYSETYIIP